jgi:hypothetical protein
LNEKGTSPVSAKRPQSRPTSLTFRLRLTKVLQELDAAVREAEGSWQEIDRDRASEIAIALAGACRVEGLKDAATMARSLGCLMKLSREQILPIEAAFKEKIREIMAFLREEAERALTGTGG